MTTDRIFYQLTAINGYLNSIISRRKSNLSQHRSPLYGFHLLTLAQNQCSAKSEIFVFPETSDEFSR
ncbi:hypothetical protein, partial [Klebsiella pneumoniae]|uniref:hypothetical protein n=1 Tax=Klebsiella pneumoniae TaxID=573 RepID=UPI0034D6C49C